MSVVGNRRVIDANAPSLYGQPATYFRPQDFEAAIWQHGYDVICEKAIRCPCQGDSDSPLPSCQNCHGFGYFFINPYRTKALMSGINRSTQYVQWAPELMGTISITVKDEDKEYISYFNRVTIEDEYASFTEMVVGREMVVGEVGVFLSYAPIEVVAVYKFKAPDKPLTLMHPTTYQIVEENPYCIKFATGNLYEGEAVSILYKHRVEYHVIDLPHEIRASLQANKQTGSLEVIKMPIQAIGRRSHLIDMQRPNYDGSGLIFNDTKSEIEDVPNTYRFKRSRR